jgi:hypothetical protein
MAVTREITCVLILTISYTRIVEWFNPTPQNLPSGEDSEGMSQDEGSMLAADETEEM